ncbi:MAG: CcmD family protein [Polyangiaceae bacterium]|nr:CcmD family protein [Polyangiaceae bacterium]
MSSPFYWNSFLFAQAAQPGPAAQADPGSPASSEQRSTSFRSVQGGDAMQSGEKLLVEAYVVIWVLVFAMLLLSWRRQKKMDERIAGLEQAVTAARAAARAGKKPSGEEAR